MITFQHKHKVITSIKLWVEHTLLDKGGAYTNFSGYFYPTSGVYGYHTYSLPYQPIVANASIAGASIMSGVYLNNVFITTGTSGLVDINYEKGQLYFNVPIANPTTSLSGNYAVADFNVKITDAPEETLLLETKHEIKPKISTTTAGLQSNDITYPVVYIKPFKSMNDPFAFGGTDVTKDDVRLIVLTDSQYSLDGVNSIVEDRVRTLIPMITGLSEMPFNNLGGFGATGQYYYSRLTTGRNHSSDSMWLEEADVINLPGTSYTELRRINPNVFVGIIDLEVHAYRNPRSD